MYAEYCKGGVFMKTGNIWIASLGEFRKLRVVTFCGIMAAAAIALNYVASIEIGQFIRIGFSGLPNQAVSFLFGPTVGALFGGALDFLKWFLKPTGAYFPGFTISAMLGGIIYGLLLYRKKPTIPRVFLAHLLIKVFVNVGLNTIWLSVLYNNAIAVILPQRILSNAIMLPIDTIICYIMLKVVDSYIKPLFRRGTKE